MSQEELCEQLEWMGYECSTDMLDRTVEYYLARTAHGSTLSRIVYAWVTSRIDPGESWQLFREALAADIDDTQGGTTPEGIHLGAMAGSLDLLQRCYSGLELHDGALWFEPRLPPDVTTLAFDLLHRDRNLAIEITHERFRLEVEPGARNPVSVAVRGELQVLAPGEVLEVDLT
jgi:trehalose/maltose hydrolase-like predicted phosphorylase